MRSRRRRDRRIEKVEGEEKVVEEQREELLKK